MTNHQMNMGTQPLKTFLARAIYDNLSENPKELNFSRGDLITVLDKNPSGLNGWWVCSIRGQLGIAPGNRLELLGLINKNKEENSDIYDDPTGWCIPNNISCQNDGENTINHSTKSTQLNGLEHTHTSINHNSCSLYENLDYFIKCPSSCGLTDSGNFSNQSSDVSFSVHSVNDGIVDQKSNPDNSNEDYEDLPPNIPEEFRDEDYSVKYEPIKSNFFEQEAILNGTHHTRDLSKQFNKDLIYSLKPQEISNDNKIKSFSNLMNSPRKDNSLDYILQNNALHSSTKTKSTEAFNEQQFTPSSFELTPNTFKSVKEFIGYWLPFQGRIHDHCLNLMKAIHQHNITNSTYSLVPLFAQLNNELIIISQLCTVMIGLSKQASLDNGLTHKFIIYRQNMENLSEMFIKLSKCTKIKYLNNNYEELIKQSINSIEIDNDIDRNKTLFEQIIQELLTEVNLFYTTILANSKILFNTSINGSHESNQKDCLLTTRKMNVINELRTSIPSLTTSSTNHSYQYLKNKQKFLSKSHEFINTLCNSNFNHESQLRNLDFQTLSQLCFSSLNIIDHYLNYLTPFQNDTLNVYSPRLQNLKKNSLSIQSVVEQTKMVMKSCSQLIRSTISICNEMKQSSSALTYSHVNDDNNYSNTVVYTRLSSKLEHTTDKLCESLKGLVTQTKETAKFITNESETFSSSKIIPIPGPLLQRLNGALKSVRNSIETIYELTKSNYRRNNYMYSSTVHIKD
ncbi:Breast cancer anti-estrogen resistance protein 1 [Schistosoma japonicum]|nr:Breast cancer anti-estrogen resistance protein 1 [Schistosoma japonicum]